MIRTFKLIKTVITKWCIIVPLTYLVPKDKNLLLLAGKDGGLFYENVKYFFIYLNKIKESNVKYYFLTGKRQVCESLKEHGLPVVFHPSFFSIYLLLRANVLIVSSSFFIRKYNYYLSFRTKKIQTWHGVSLKKMELAYYAKHIVSIRDKIDNAIRGKFFKHDLVISTSAVFTDKVFSKALRTKDILESGYPRNDIFFKELDENLVLIGADRYNIEKIYGLKSAGKNIITYAPTFRDTGGDAIADGVLNIDRLASFANKNKAVFVFKFHVLEHTRHNFGKYGNCNILMYDSTSDIQPLLKLSDVLITDYSSVYMDFLLLDRPMIFFPYDYRKYIEKDRDLFFDYDSITPGPKCYSQGELETTITNILSKNKDDYSHERERVRDIAFKYKDGKASERIWSFIKANYL